MYEFNKEELMNFEKSDGKCFVLPNGLGGYSSQSIINSCHRKQYGYLIACLKPPVDRKLILTRINETIKIGDEKYDLESQRYEDSLKEGNNYLKSFSYGYIPTYNYEVGGLCIEKKLAPKFGYNTVAISYNITSKVDATIYLEPLFNYRDHCQASKECELDFKCQLRKNTLILTPQQNKTIKIRFNVSEGLFISNSNQYSKPHYCEYDVSTGDERLDVNYKPYMVKIDVKANESKKISVICTIDSLPKVDADSIITDYQKRLEKLIRKSKITTDLGENLVVASDAFICERSSTGLKTILAGLPWFTDWGRDTMISFTGLTLVTRRFKEAREILKSFSLYEKNGLIPNMFPDDGGVPLYNTVDASLWYFYACYKYVEYTNDYKFIQNEIYPTLKNIIAAYETSTDFSIHMDSDCLIHAGSDQDQVTWMDVRTNGVAVTPRHGKPVEINALWYNALMIISEFSKKFNDRNDHYSELASKVYKSFNEKFFCYETNCLFDTVDEYDKKIRPNQIWVLSLPFKVLDKSKAKNVFDVVEKELYNVYGLRSLAISDPEFKPKYEGKLLDRDYAYHMGTTWGFLLGGYIDACSYVYPDNKEKAEQIVNAVIPHLNDGCINGFAEIFDGDVASRTRGCYTQAWSIGELLRAYYENILSK